MTLKRPSGRRTASITLFIGAVVAAAAAGIMAAPFTSERVSAAPAKPTGFASAFLAGRHAQATADGQAAVGFYDQALSYDPKNLGLLTNTYFLAAQIGDFAAALPAARKAYDIDPKAGMSAVLLGLDHYKRGEYDRAWFYFGKIPAQSMNGFAVPLLRAWGAAPSQPADKALAELTQLKSFPETASLVDLMGGLLNEFYGNTAAALANYDALAKTLDKQPLSAVRLVAEGYMRLGKTEQAKEMLKRYETEEGASPVIDAYLDGGAAMPKKITPQIGMSDALYAAAELLVLNNVNEYRTEVSTAYAQTALYLNPDLSMARQLVGLTLAARGRVDEANATLAQIKKSSPDYPEAQMRIAGNLAAAHKDAEALTVLRGVVKDRPTWADAYGSIGDLLRNDKKFTEAVTAYDSAIKATPADSPKIWELYYARGVAFDRAKQWDQAEKDFRKALELKPNQPDVLNYLGYSYLDRGIKLDEAHKMIEAAFNKLPNDGYIIDSYGWMLYRDGNYAKAVQELEKAVEAVPADATINEHLGDAYWKTGRKTEARFQWERALGLDLDEESQRTALRGKLEHGLAQK